MPKPSPRARLPHSDTHKIPTCLPELSRRANTSAPNNGVIGRKMSIRKLLESLPKRQHDAEKYFSSECKIKARRAQSLRNNHLIVVFKRTGSGRNKSSCGMANCSRCGMFWQMYVESLERAVPGLVCEQFRPPRPKSFHAFDTPSTPGSSISTLTEFTEEAAESLIFSSEALETELPTPSSTSSSFADLVSQHEIDISPSASSTSSPTAFTEHNFIGRISFPPLLTSLSALIDHDEISNPFSSPSPSTSSISTLTEFSEQASSVSTLTDFSSLPSSSTLSPPPSTSSSTASVSTISPLATRTLKLPSRRTRSHKNMITMSDGSEWLPPTLERVQAYISSQGQRRLARSARRVVEQKAERGSRVARDYERGILRVDSKISGRDG